MLTVSSTLARHLTTYGRSRVESYIDHRTLRTSDSLCVTTTSSLSATPSYIHVSLPFLSSSVLFLSFIRSLAHSLAGNLAREYPRTTGNLTGALWENAEELLR